MKPQILADLLLSSILNVKIALEKAGHYFGKQYSLIGWLHFHRSSAAWIAALYLGFRGVLDVPLRLLSFAALTPFCVR